MPRLRVKRKTVFIVALIIVTITWIGIRTWRAWERARDYAKVTVSNATAWQQRTSGSMGPASEVTITLDTPYHRPYTDAEVIIESWTDDRGTDFLIPELHPFSLNQWYTWGLRVFAKKGGFGSDPTPGIVPAANSSTPTQIAWIAGSPVDASPAATSIRVKGYVQFHEGRERKSVRIESSNVFRGYSFQLGSTQCVVAGISSYSHNPPIKPVSFRSSDCRAPWVSVKFVDGEGKELTWQGVDTPGYRGAQKAQEQIDSPLARIDEVDCPPASTYAAMIIEYWSKVSTRTIPFDMSVPLTHRSHSNPGIAVQGPTKLLPSPSSVSFIEPLPAGAWGPRASGDPSELFEVVPERDERFDPKTYSAFWPEFRVRFKRPLNLVSFNVALTSCRDSVGNELFRSRPARSSVSQHWGIEIPRYVYFTSSDEDKGQPDKEVWFQIQTDQIPSLKSTNAEFQGILTVKFADSLTTIEVSGVSVAEKTKHKIGSVEVGLRTDDKTGLVLDTRGDLGLIRELAFLSHDGNVLYQIRRVGLAVYWSNSSRIYTGLTDPAKMKDIRRIRAQYYADCCHHVLPFSVNVSFRKKG